MMIRGAVVKFSPRVCTGRVSFEDEVIPKLTPAPALDAAGRCGASHQGGDAVTLQPTFSLMPPTVHEDGDLDAQRVT